jgi:hypothetical protein
MLLAASTEDHGTVVLISPEEEIANGSRVGWIIKKFLRKFWKNI